MQQMWSVVASSIKGYEAHEADLQLHMALGQLLHAHVQWAIFDAQT